MSENKPDPTPRTSPPQDPSADDDAFAGKTVRGGMITVGSQVSKFVLNIAALVVMARLLAPEDFGLVAMVLPIVALITLLQDFGLSAATIQRKEISPAQSSNLFWLNVGASAVLAATLVALAPAVASFYDDARLTWVTIALAGLVLSSGLTAQHLALMTRRMEFLRLAKQDIAALAIGLAAGIIAAWRGLDYWAIIIGMGSRSVTLLVLVWAGAKWRPGLPSRGSGVRPLVRFGRNLTLNSFSNFLIENMDSIMIGKMWGSYQLGFYDRAYSILRLYKQVNGPVNTVANTVLSKLQHDPPRFRQYYIQGIGLVTGVSMPLMAFLATNATNVIRLGLGDKWLPAVPIFLALAPAAFIGTIKPATWWIYTSLGRTDRQLKWSAYVQLPITLAAYAAGLPYGPIGVALAFSIVTVALVLPSILFCLRDFKAYLELRHVLRAILPAAFAALTAAALQFLLNRFVLRTESLNAIAAMAVDVAVYGLLYTVIYCALPVGRQNIVTYARVIGKAVGLRI